MAFDREPVVQVKYGLFFNRREVVYTSHDTKVSLEAGEVSDGVTLTWFTKLFITPREYLLGTNAALVHDHMCKNKSQYDRKISSKMLRDIWISDGLNPIKGYLVYFFTDLYQFIRYRKEWKS